MLFHYIRPSQWIAVTAAVVLAIIFFSAVSTWPSAPKPPRWRSIGHPRESIIQDINNATLGFQKIFVINLPARSDHRDSMSLAAHLTGLTVDYIEAVTHVEEKALPPHHDLALNPGQLGNWRAHMNILRAMVEQNVTSALILEDDADWDLRIKSQMQTFAEASRLFVQPLQDSPNSYLDPTVGQQSEKDQTPLQIQLGQASIPPILKPTTSPYGDVDRWDLLWLGHCGTRFPKPGNNIPLMRVSNLDETVPEQQHIDMQFGNGELVRDYPAHTRVVSRASENVCTLAYAVSLPGARRMLYEFGVNKLDASTDLSFRQMCDGIGRQQRTCLTVQPQLFQHHRPVGPKTAESDISPHPDEYNEKAFTRNVRFSTRLNFAKLLDGQTDYIDLFKDGEPKVDLGF